MIIQRTWHESSGTVSNDELVSIHEVRGNGRRRHMLRPWNFQSDGQGGWTLSPDNASALWTVYDGDEPTADYRIIDGDGPGFTGDLEKSYTLGLAQRTGEGEVKYFHTDHLGTTQAMTDANQTPEPRIVYTAFGEVISASSPPDTRYQYVGEKGYESFSDLPFLHVGHRWYDPASGRFLQRDPLGIDGGMNVYVYAAGTPTSSADPSGLDRFYERKPGHSYFYLERDDGTYDRYDFVPGPGDNGEVNAGIITTTTGKIHHENVKSVPKGAVRWRSTRNEDERDRELIEEQRKNPPRYHFWGTHGHNCMSWATQWVKKVKPRTSRPEFCFPAGTLVLTEGGLAAIENVRIGTAIPSLNPENHQQQVAEVASVQQSETSLLVHITARGEIISCTREHPVWVVRRGWTHAGDLDASDELLSVRYGVVGIDRLESEALDKPVHVYALTVESSGTYLVGKTGILVHNKPYP